MEDPNNHVFTEIEIHATPEQVWRVLTDWGRLSEWSSSFIGISTPRMVVGEEFVSYFRSPLTAKPLELSHVCTAYDEGRMFAWSGDIIGRVRDHHIYSVEGTAQGTAIFRQEDGLHGPHSRLMNFLASHKMVAMYQKFNEELKARVEALYPGADRSVPPASAT